MGRTFTLLELRTRALRRAGIDTSADMTPAVVNEFVNDGIARLWDLFKGKDDDRLTTSTTLNTSVGVAEVALPATFLELRKLEIADTSLPSGYRRLRSASLDAQHLYSSLYGKRYRYRLQGSNLVLMPTPARVETLRLYFIPYATVLTADGDTFDGYNGYERYVVEYTYREILGRQNLDTSAADGRLARFEAEIAGATDGRDSEPFYLDPRGANRDDELEVD